MEKRELWTLDLGVRPYAEVLLLQREAAKKRISGEIPEDLLILVEHPPVVTLGRRKEDNKLPVTEAYLTSKGIELFEVERGGGVTFHGPGQLVGYPIISLERHKKDLHWYLRQVEEAIMNTLGRYSIPSERSTGFTGVWTADKARKMASIGVHARAWVTWHGFALNVTTDLAFFDLMVPCGIDGVTMTSMIHEVPTSDFTVRGVGQVFGEEFATLFSLTTKAVTLEEIGL